MRDPRMRAWTGGGDGEAWRVEVEVDRMKEGQPHVVTVYTRHHDGTDDHTTLACLTPDQAMGISDVLWECAMRASDLDRH